MDEIITHLRNSIADEVLSKSEKRSLKDLVIDANLSVDQLNFLRSKIYELANEKVTERNYHFILEWVKTASSALLSKPTEKSNAYFSPGESCRSTIISQINNATTRLSICVFTISDDAISNAILTAHARSVKIRIITDNDKSLDVGSDIERLSKKGLAVKMDNTNNHMHHKFMIADDRTVLTGSYNWTQSAAKFNHENILLTTDPGVVKSFLQEFENLWSKMESYR